MSMLTKLGGVGWIILLVAGILILVNQFVNNNILTIVDSYLLGIGILVVGLGAWALGRQVEHPLVTIGGYFGFVAGIWSIIVYSLQLGGVVRGLYEMSFYSLSGITAGMSLTIITIALTSAFFLSVGLGVLQSCLKFRFPTIAGAGGVATMIIGVLYISFIGTASVSAFLIPASIINLIVFWLS
ncbi:hypothetical protein HYS54_04060 [Candidatus Micrarchaeota archaeon]|nr:hypothetical protein [Candidatus Micrarchaeota archaeon]